MLVFDGIEKFGHDGIILRVENLEDETIMRVSIDPKSFAEIIEKNMVDVLEEFDIAYEEEDHGDFFDRDDRDSEDYEYERFCDDEGYEDDPDFKDDDLEY